MLYGQPAAQGYWLGNRFIRPPVMDVPRGLMSNTSAPSAALQQQAQHSNSPLYNGEGGGVADSISASFSSNEGKATSGPSMADLAPDRGGMMSSIAGTLGNAVAGPAAGLLGSVAGGAAGGWGAGKSVGSAVASTLGGLVAGPIGALAGGLLGGNVGGMFDPMSDKDFAAMISKDFGYDPAAYDLAPGGIGLGGISPGVGGPLSMTPDGRVAGYGALGTPSSFGFANLGGGVGGATGPGPGGFGAGPSQNSDGSFGVAGLGGDPGGGDAGGGKIVCTAMCESYGFGSFRQKLWLAQSRDLAPEYQAGYHALFLPLVSLAYGKNVRWLRRVLEHIARHRTADIWKQKRGKRDWIGAAERVLLEPLCYVTGWAIGKRAQRFLAPARHHESAP